MKKEKKNVILCDCNPPEKWSFQNGVVESSKMAWERIEKVNNNQKGRFAGIKRYIRYFTFSFHSFCNRKKYKNIIAWQQFYGLIYAFFCRLFHVKKVNNLFIMIFIYIPKKGFKGKIYKKFMRYMVTSKYIDKIIVFSSTEAKRYSEELDVDENKFVFLPFGDDVIESNTKVELEDGFIFTSGYSNRDYDFLIDTLSGTSYVTRIYGKTNYCNDNIIMSDEYIGPKLDSMLKKCKLVVVPLKENRESGQFTILHAMQAGIPVIATDTDCMKDYIQDGVNGFLCPNNKEKWLEKINLLYSDEELYKKLSDNCKRIYAEKHTLIALGKNVGNVISKALEEN